jgi:retrograde regulation protein 2
LSKEVASMAALYSTITGVLASAHGLSHSARARIALMLENRYDGELPPREVLYKHRLRDLLTPEEVWWCNYAGVVAWLIGQIYPSGVVGSQPKLWLSARFADNLGKDRDKNGIELTIAIPRATAAPDGDDDFVIPRRRIDAYAKKVGKVGKKKNWIGGKEGWGMAVNAIVAEQLSLE